MKKYNRIIICLVAAMVMLFMASCGGPDGSVQAFPCMPEGSESWTLAGDKGLPLDDVRFEHPTTAVVEGRFWMQNDQGCWELFDYAGNKCERVCEREFRHVSDFYGGRALVAERDKPVSIVDRSGRDVMMLDSVAGVAPDNFTNIANGIAVFSADTLYGAVDYHGRIVVPVIYPRVCAASCGRIVAFSGEWIRFQGIKIDEQHAEAQAHIYDCEGNELFTVSNSTYSLVADEYTGGYLPVGVEQGESVKWGLLDENGAVAMVPRSGVCGIEEVKGKNFIYRTEKGQFGLMDLEGNILLQPRYSHLRFIDSGHLMATEGSLDDVDIDNLKPQEYRLITLAGDPVTQDAYLDISPLIGDALFVQGQDEVWSLIHLDGEPVKGAQRYSAVLLWWRDLAGMVSSDYIDLEQLVEGVELSANGVGDLSFQSSVRAALEAQSRFYSMNEPPQPSNYSFTNEVNIYPTIEGEMVAETVTFPSTLSKQIYRDEKVIDFVWGYNYWYHINKVPTGFAFTSQTPRKFTVRFNNYGKLRGKLRPLFNLLVKKLTAIGDVTDNNGAATLIALRAGRDAMVVLEPNSVRVEIGALDFSERDLSPYKGNTEDLSPHFFECEADGNDE